MRNAAVITAVLLCVLFMGMSVEATTWTVPGTVNAGGLNGTRFVSDFAITNPAAVPVQATISFIPAGGTTPKPVTLNGGETIVYRNVLDRLWGAEGNGATQVVSDLPLLIRARTYNTAASGTYGVALPVFAGDRLLQIGDKADSLWISQSANGSSGYRTNVAVVFPDDGGGSASVTVFDGNGVAIGSQNYSLDAPGFQQFPVSSFAGAVPAGRAEVFVTRGRAAGYSVVVDNVTGDGSLFAFEDLPGGFQDVLVNGVARANGKENTFFRTDGRFYNPGTSEATVSVAFHDNQNANPVPLTRTFTVPAGKIRDVVDILGSLLGLPVGSVGALRFQSEAPVAIVCRTSNVDPTGVNPGTYGAQQKPRQLLSFLMSADAGAVVTGIRQNVAFRTNIGFAAGADGADYSLTLKSMSGATVATATGSLGAFGWTQPNVANIFPGTAIPEDATLLVRVTSGSVDVFDSSVDNASGDPVVTSIMPLPANIPSAATIGPEGGSVRSSDGKVTLKVPAGALPSPAEISLAAALSDAPNGIGPGYLLTVPPEVEGRALLVLDYGAREIAGSGAEALSLAFKGGDGWYIGMGGTLDAASRSITLPLLSTSPPGIPLVTTQTLRSRRITMAVLQAWTIVPTEASVRTNGQVKFWAYFVGPPTTSEPFSLANPFGTPNRAFYWRASESNNVRVSWFVEKGDTRYGTITSSSNYTTATYTAPCQVPPRNPVWVFYVIEDARLVRGPTTAHSAIVHILPGARFGEIGPLANTCGPAPIWEGTVSQRSDRSGYGQTTTIRDTASVAFEFDDTAHAQPGQVIYRLRSGSYTYNLLFVDGNYPCQTVTTAAGLLPTAPYQPGVLGTTAATLVFQTGTTPASYYGSGASIVLFTQTTSCNSLRRDVTTTDPFHHFWWLQSGGEVSQDGKTIQGSQDQPDGMGGVLHWEWLLTKRE